MPRKTKRDQTAAVSVYEASPGRAPADAHDAADEMLPPEHRFTDEERARPSLTWLQQAAVPGRERRAASKGTSPSREITVSTRASDAAAPASVAVVVDGDAIARGVAAAILERTDLMVITCDNAVAAFEVMQEHSSNVAVLFIDVELPGPFDGPRLALEVLRNWPDTRVVMTSRRDLVEDMPDRAVYMPKPWKPADVMEAVANLRGLKAT